MLMWHMWQQEGCFHHEKGSNITETRLKSCENLLRCTASQRKHIRYTGHRQAFIELIVYQHL